MNPSTGGWDDSINVLVVDDSSVIRQVLTTTLPHDPSIDGIGDCQSAVIAHADHDDAKGLKEMHDMGARTMGQDEDSCVVYGMPKEAAKLGAVDRELPLSRIALEIVAYGGGR